MAHICQSRAYYPNLKQPTCRSVKDLLLEPVKSDFWKIASSEISQVYLGKSDTDESVSNNSITDKSEEFSGAGNFLEDLHKSTRIRFLVCRTFFRREYE